MKQMRVGLLALVLTAGATIAVHTSKASNARQVEIYTITDPNNPDVGKSGNFNQIKPSCPGETVLCATGDQGDQIFWNE
jgi:hypothetical protein